MPASNTAAGPDKTPDGHVVVTVRTVSAKKDPTPPLVSFKLTNPVTYLKIWWKRVVAADGIDFRLKIHPLTALILAFIFLGGGYSLGHFVIPPVIVQYLPSVLISPSPLASPSPDPWKDTAYQGTLRFSAATKRYYLSTSSAQAITLEVPSAIDLEPLIGKKIFAVGRYNSKTDILIVSEITSLAVLPSNTVPIPTFTPTPSATASPISTPETPPSPSVTPATP